MVYRKSSGTMRLTSFWFFFFTMQIFAISRVIPLISFFSRYHSLLLSTNQRPRLQPDVSVSEAEKLKRKKKEAKKKEKLLVTYIP